MKKEVKPDKKSKELLEKVAELTQGWQRTQADFVNYKKQVALDHAKFCRTANADLVYELLPVLDNFQRAAKHTPSELEDNTWAQGIKHIERQLEDVLLNVGLTKIESVGMQFDPLLHEAVEEVESDKPEGEIVEEVLSGYKFDTEILRPAKVKVSKGNFHSEQA